MDVEKQNVRSTQRGEDRNKHRNWKCGKSSEDSVGGSDLREWIERRKRFPDPNAVREDVSCEKGSNDSKRKRTRDDITSSRYFKTPHRDSSLGSSDDGNSSCSHDSPRRNKFRKRQVEIETDQAILSRRQKQIDYGKNTIGYDRYCHLIPKNQRKHEHPNTPPKHVKYSRRAWDGLVKIWRMKLHDWDPPLNENEVQESTDLPEASKTNSATENGEKVDTPVKCIKEELCSDKETDSQE